MKLTTCLRSLCGAIYRWVCNCEVASKFSQLAWLPRWRCFFQPRCHATLRKTLQCSLSSKQAGDFQCRRNSRAERRAEAARNRVPNEVCYRKSIQDILGMGLKCRWNCSGLIRDREARMCAKSSTAKDVPRCDLSLTGKSIMAK